MYARVPFPARVVEPSVRGVFIPAPARYAEEAVGSVAAAEAQLKATRALELKRKMQYLAMPSDLGVHLAMPSSSPPVPYPEFHTLELDRDLDLEQPSWPAPMPEMPAPLPPSSPKEEGERQLSKLPTRKKSIRVAEAMELERRLYAERGALGAIPRTMESLLREERPQPEGVPTNASAGRSWDPISWDPVSAARASPSHPVSKSISTESGGLLSQFGRWLLSWGNVQHEGRREFMQSPVEELYGVVTSPPWPASPPQAAGQQAVRPGCQPMFQPLLYDRRFAEPQWLGAQPAVLVSRRDGSDRLVSKYLSAVALRSHYPSADLHRPMASEVGTSALDEDNKISPDEADAVVLQEVEAVQDNEYHALIAETTPAPLPPVSEGEALAEIQKPKEAETELERDVEAVQEPTVGQAQIMGQESTATADRRKQDIAEEAVMKAALMEKASSKEPVRRRSVVDRIREMNSTHPPSTLGPFPLRPDAPSGQPPAPPPIPSGAASSVPRPNAPSGQAPVPLGLQVGGAPPPVSSPPGAGASSEAPKQPFGDAPSFPVPLPTGGLEA